jgi:hypothetical protein
VRCKRCARLRGLASSVHYNVSISTMLRSLARWVAHRMSLKRTIVEQTAILLRKTWLLTACSGGARKPFRPSLNGDLFDKAFIYLLEVRRTEDARYLRRAVSCRLGDFLLRLRRIPAGREQDRVVAMPVTWIRTFRHCRSYLSFGWFGSGGLRNSPPSFPTFSSSIASILSICPIPSIPSTCLHCLHFFHSFHCIQSVHPSGLRFSTTSTLNTSSLCVL